jgi:hypothetical protein
MSRTSSIVRALIQRRPGYNLLSRLEMSSGTRLATLVDRRLLAVPRTEPGRAELPLLARQG